MHCALCIQRKVKRAVYANESREGESCQQILSVNWNKLQSTSQSTLSSLANATTQIPVSKLSSTSVNHTTPLALANLGIPLTWSMAMGFAVGFMKGWIGRND